jgi:hypothetical protein
MGRDEETAGLLSGDDERKVGIRKKKKREREREKQIQSTA